MASLRVSFLVVVCLCCGALQSHGQEPQCGELDVGNVNDEVVSGAGLSFCSTTSPQCCPQSYINSVMMVADSKLRQGLREQLRETNVIFNSTVNFIGSYFNRDFRRAFISFLPNLRGQVSFDSLESIAGSFVDSISNNLVINDNTRNFNVTQVAFNIITALGNAAAQLLGGQSADTRMCVLNAIQSNINQTDVAVVVRAIEELRRAVTVLERAVAFLDRYRLGTQFQFPRNCVRRFVELNFCARCMRKIPPLCTNTCGALVRGCLSSYYTALSRQFDILWNVSLQVVTLTNNTLQKLFVEERQLLDETAALSQVIRCPGASLPGVGKRQSGNGDGSTNFIPQERIQELRDLKGIAFRYTRDRVTNYEGPVICRPSRTELSFCNVDGMPTRSQNCSSTDSCTSPCRCFNGKSEQMSNTEEFNVDGISGQENNPVIDLDTDELTEIATSIGTPVSSFLMQDDIAVIIPSDVKVPSGEPFNGATTLQLSAAFLLLAAIALLFSN